MVIVSVIIGGVLAIIGGIVGNYIFLNSQKNLDRKNLEGGFAGEISALMSIVKTRKYIENLEKIIQTIKKRHVKIPFYFQVSYNYFNVYEKNVDKLGLLNQPLPELIAKFYTQCFSILEDIKQMGKLDINAMDEEQLIGHYTELLMLFKDNAKIGEAIIKDIREK